MNNNFENVSRRELLKQAGLLGAGLSVSAALGTEGEASTSQATEPIRIGSGYWTYQLVTGWGILPGKLKYGMGCGVVVDSKDRVYVHSRSQHALVVLDSKGNVLNDWGAEFAGTAHGIYLSKEGKDEFLYLTDHPRNTIFKTDLEGRRLMRIGDVPYENSTSIKFKFNQPTDVAVAPNGDIYVCEGYGSQLVHRFTKRGKHLKTIGGPGKTNDKFNVCHGVWLTTHGTDLEVYVADRANGRLQVFTPDLTYKRSIGDVRNPCCFYEHKGHLYIPDLDHRVTIFDPKDQVVAQLGDGKGKDRNDPTGFEKPHAMCVDSQGSMYVIEWRDDARLRKFRHTPQ